MSVVIQIKVFLSCFALLKFNPLLLDNFHVSCQKGYFKFSTEHDSTEWLLSLQMTILSLSKLLYNQIFWSFLHMNLYFNNSEYQSHTYTSMYVYTLVFVKLK